MEFNNIGDATQPQAERMQPQTARDTRVSARFTFRSMRPIVENSAFGSEPIF